MYRITRSQKLTSAIVNIVEGVSLSSLLDKTYQTTQALLCPTNAIIVQENRISENECVSCGLCKKTFSEYIEYIPTDDDWNKFYKYCTKKKMFIYRWLSQIISSLAGTEISIVGFSRTKRIPLTIVDDHRIIIVKCAINARELEKTINDLATIEYLLRDTINKYNLVKSVIIIEEPHKKRALELIDSIGDCEILSLSSIYSTLVLQSARKHTMSELLSSCG